MSSNSYDDRHESKIYGALLIIHHRNDLDVDTYFFRAKIAGVKGYVRRSCGTNDAAKAMVAAESAFVDLLVRHKGGFSLKELTVDKFFTDWIERKRHNFTATRAQWKKSVYERYMSGYFGHRNISELNKKFCDDYWEYRLNFWNSAAGIEVRNLKGDAGRLKTSKTPQDTNKTLADALGTIGNLFYLQRKMGMYVALTAAATGMDSAKQTKILKTIEKGTKRR